MGSQFRSFRNRLAGSALLMLIAVNVAVWLVLRIDALAEFAMTRASGPGALYYCIAMPTAYAEYPLHLYSLITYMFAQYDLWHLICNMLVLYWFGSRFLDISTGRQMVALYMYGGLAGAAACLVGYNLIYPGSASYLIGSSASVLAILTAAAALMPDYPIPLLLVGEVKLKWIAIAAAVIVLLNMSGLNFGGELAHAGGILMGLVYAFMRKRGTDITKPLLKTLDWLARPFARQTSVKRPDVRRGQSAKKQKRTESETAELDALLDKVKLSGFSGLTEAEKRRLWELSSKI